MGTTAELGSYGAPALLCAAACTVAAPPELAPAYVDVGTELRLNAIDGKYAVGEAGVVLIDGELAELGELAAGVALHAALDCLVSGCPDYVVGDAGTILVREDQVWARVDLGIEADLHDVARVDADVIVLGETVRVWDEWEGPESGFDPAPPDGSGWGRLRDYLAFTAVGDAGSIVVTPDLHTWTREQSGTDEDLLALGYYDPDPSDFDPGELWAVGRSGTVLTRSTGAWEAIEFGLDCDLLDYASGHAITDERELLRLDPSGASEVVSRFDRMPLALDISAYERTTATVVGERGLFATVDLGPGLEP